MNIRTTSFQMSWWESSDIFGCCWSLKPVVNTYQFVEFYCGNNEIVLEKRKLYKGNI